MERASCLALFFFIKIKNKPSAKQQNTLNDFFGNRWNDKNKTGEAQ